MYNLIHIMVSEGGISPLSPTGGLTSLHHIITATKNLQQTEFRGRVRRNLHCITTSKPAVKCLLRTFQGIVPATLPHKNVLAPSSGYTVVGTNC